MPIVQHPFDGSWGYQATGFYSVDSRYGNPKQLMSFVDRMHQAGIGVIFDFAPVHFAVDEFALIDFDGAHLFEPSDPNRMFSPWGSAYFDLGKDPVRSFLMSAMNYYCEMFHIDGLRIDAVSNMLFYDGDKSKGTNDGAVEFLKRTNGLLHARHPSLMMIAEDSSDFYGVTKPTDQNGVGFDYKWDLGWMNDTLKYYHLDPIYKKYDHNKLTFSMMYYHSEYYILPFSHDENVHGKATILQKMHGLYDGKFAQARAFYLYNAIHPGKLLNFMGEEFGQLREWDETREQDWFLLKYPMHDAFQHYIKTLNHLYLKHSALFERDYTEGGFEWLDCTQNYPCCYAIKRNSSKESVIGVFNFAGAPQDHYVLHCDAKRLTIILDSSADIYNGTRPNTAGTVIEGNNGEFVLSLPAFSGICLQVE